MPDRKATIRADLDKRKVQQGIGQLDRGLGSLKRTAVSLGVALGIGLGGAAFVGFLKGATQEALANEQALKRSATQMRIFGIETDGNIDRLKKLISTESLLSGAVSAQVNDAFTRLLITTGDFNQAMEYTPLVLDMASTGLFSVESSARNLSRAFSGTVGELGEVLPGLAKLIRELGAGASAADKMKVSMDYLTETFGGARLENVKTYAGQIERLKRAWDSFKEIVGQEVLAKAFAGGNMEALRRNLELSTRLFQMSEEQRRIEGFRNVTDKYVLMRGAGAPQHQFLKPFASGYERLEYRIPNEEALRRLSEYGSLLAPGRGAGMGAPGVGGFIPTLGIAAEQAKHAAAVRAALAEMGTTPALTPGQQWLFQQQILASGAAAMAPQAGLPRVGATGAQIRPGGVMPQWFDVPGVTSDTAMQDQSAKFWETFREGMKNWSQGFESALSASLQGALTSGDVRKGIEAFADQIKSKVGKAIADAISKAIVKEILPDILPFGLGNFLGLGKGKS